MKRITDPSFVYVQSANTDIRKTFERIRKELAKAEAKPPEALVHSLRVVRAERAK
jgi:hypothetical protein